jgi:hypothetical protein
VLFAPKMKYLRDFVVKILISLHTLYGSIPITVSRKKIPITLFRFEPPNQSTMDFYFINTQPFDPEAYELHKGNCYFMPLPHNRQYIGLFTHPKYALHKALTRYSKVYCCELCCHYEGDEIHNTSQRKSIQ